MHVCVWYMCMYVYGICIGQPMALEAIQDSDPEVACISCIAERSHGLTYL